MFKGWIKLNKYNYKHFSLDSLSKQERFERINEIIDKFYYNEKTKNEEEKKQRELEQQENENYLRLLPVYDQLVGILIKAQEENITVSMDVTTNENHKYSYHVEKFKVSYLSKFICLCLKNEERWFDVTLSEISKIVINEKNNCLVCKIWTKNYYKTICINIPSTKLPTPITENIRNVYKRELEEYEKLKGKDNYKYHIGYVKFEYGTPILEGEYETKYGVKFYLCCYKDKVILSDKLNRSIEAIYFQIKDDLSMEIVEFILPETLRNKGIGTIVLNLVLDYAKSERVTIINGMLSDVDNHNKERRNHVYKKAGFTVGENSIELVLNKENNDLSLDNNFKYLNK